MIQAPTKLPKRQQQLFDQLLGRGDVPIDRLFYTIATLRAQGVPAALKTQYQQRYLGPYITALNRNLAERNLHVEPGALKNSYRLVAVKA